VILLDANVLVYALDATSPMHTPSLAVLTAAVNGRVPALLVPQVLLECYSAATRGPHGVQPGDMLAQLAFWRTHIPVLDVKAEVMEEFNRVVSHTPRAGGAVYDLFLVAQMRSHGVREICTYNIRDFQLPGVRAYTPQQTLTRHRGR
jgi:predicted nucleic acid-binding protein